MFKALEKAWQSINEELFITLAKSMEARVAAVIAAEGWYTRY